MSVPADYRCAGCGAHGVKLWRGYMDPRPVLRCGPCTKAHEGRALNLDASCECGWSVPAVPRPQGGFFPYFATPADAAAWWWALPVTATQAVSDTAGGIA